MLKLYKFVLPAMAVLCSCQNNDELRDKEGSFGNAIILDRVNDKQPGIIDGYEFFTTHPGFLDGAIDAVGSLAIYAETGEIVGGGVGIHIKDSYSGREFILTAAHVIYDIRDNFKKGDRIFFGYQDSEFGNIIQNISNLPQQNLTMSGQDWLLIPVYSSDDRIPLLVNFAENEFRVKSKASEVYEGYFLSISSITANEKKDSIRFSQTGRTIYGSPTQLDGSAYTDLDAVKGMSGSPVFYVVGSKIELIGVLKSRSNQNDCYDVAYKLCANKVSLLPRNDKINSR